MSVNFAALDSSNVDCVGNIFKVSVVLYSIFQLFGIVCLSSLVCLCGHSKKSCMDKAM